MSGPLLNLHSAPLRAISRRALRDLCLSALQAAPPHGSPAAAAHGSAGATPGSGGGGADVAAAAAGGGEAVVAYVWLLRQLLQCRQQAMQSTAASQEYFSLLQEVSEGPILARGPFHA